MTIASKRGFTLPELLTVVTVAGVLGFVAVPAMTEFVARQRVETLRDQLEHVLFSARNAAASRSNAVAICGSSDMTTCDGGWRVGWLMFDASDDTIIQRTEPQRAGSLNWAGFGPQIRFLHNGTSPTSNGRFYQCRNGTLAWQLVLSRQGRLRRGTAAENLARASLCE